jgi:hypothetical protein
MPKLIAIVDSSNPNKRYTAIFDVDGRKKKVNFGDPNMDSYVMHHDKERRERYWKRHEKDLRTNDPMRPGYLSFFLLWGKSRILERNIATYKRLFNL